MVRHERIAQSLDRYQLVSGSFSFDELAIGQVPNGHYGSGYQGPFDGSGHHLAELLVVHIWLLVDVEEHKDVRVVVDKEGQTRDRIQDW